MVFYVNVVTFVMTLVMNKSTRNAINDWNLDEVHAIIEAKFDTLYI